MGKGENAGNQHFLLFPQFFLTYHRQIIIDTTFILSYANALNLVESQILSLGKVLTHYNTIPHLDTMENTVGKEEIAFNKRFLLFSQCFLPFTVLIFHFKCTLKCRLQFVSIWTSLKFCRLVKI